MPDFTNSINQGMNSAQKADENKREINSVFEELNKQLSTVTNGKVKIERKNFSPSTDSMLGVLSKFSNPSLFKDYLGIAILHTIHKLPAIEIAKWEMDKTGYPCKIKIDQEEYYCEDKEGLEKTLSFLMTQPDVGAAILKYMNYSNKEELNKK